MNKNPKSKAVVSVVTSATKTALVAILLVLVLVPQFRIVWALECRQETLFYDNWNDRKIYEDSDLFADTTHLDWGTEVCPVRIKKRWLTTWVLVRLENGETGWLDDSDLLTYSDFHESVITRHSVKTLHLEDLIAEINRIETLMETLQIDVPSSDLLTALLSWIPNEFLSDAAQSTDSTKEPKAGSLSKVSSTPIPQNTVNPQQADASRPTRTPRPTDTPRPTHTPRPTNTPRPNLQATRQAEESRERQKGFHCLSLWDGNHDGFERLVKPLLNDPDSMKTHETRIAPVEEGNDGRLGHYIIMDFGAKNAFGAMVRHIATGWVDNETCEATLIGVE